MDNEIFWVEISLAIVTLLAVAVALFQERLKRYWNRAIMDMKINLEPPDCHQIMLNLPSLSGMGLPSIYIRIKVVHISGPSAENVEITPVNFWEVEEGNKLRPLKYFLPISLTWSHFQPKTNYTRIPAESFRHCDFGFFIQEGQSSFAVLKLDTIVQPNLVAQGKTPNVIMPGKYQFELLLCGDNIKSLRKRWLLEFKNWNDQEFDMLNNNIKIVEV